MQVLHRSYEEMFCGLMEHWMHQRIIMISTRHHWSHHVVDDTGCRHSSFAIHADATGAGLGSTRLYDVICTTIKSLQIPFY